MPAEVLDDASFDSVLLRKSTYPRLDGSEWDPINQTQLCLSTISSVHPNFDIDASSASWAMAAGIRPSSRMYEEIRPHGT